jgi:hypothetical protein
MFLQAYTILCIHVCDTAYCGDIFNYDIHVDETA